VAGSYHSAAGAYHSRLRRAATHNGSASRWRCAQINTREMACTALMPEPNRTMASRFARSSP
jgi:hypothetical protein